MQPFHEIQKLGKAPRIIAGSIAALIILGGILLLLTEGTTEFLVFLCICVPVSAMSLSLVYFFRLETEIDMTSIRVRVRPFHRKFKEFRWDDIYGVYVREYKPIGEFGGWGIRRSTDGRAYNARGNMGLQLVLKNSKKILIGTSEPEQLKHWLKQRDERKNMQ